MTSKDTVNSQFFFGRFGGIKTSNIVIMYIRYFLFLWLFFGTGYTAA